MGPISVPGRWCLAAAVATAFGVLVPPALVVVALIVVLWLVGRRFGYQAGFLVCLLAVFGSMSGCAGDARSKSALEGPIPEGRISLSLVVKEDPTSFRGWMAVGKPTAIHRETSIASGAGLMTPWDGPALAVGPLPFDVVAGDRVLAEGSLAVGARRLGNDVVAGTFRVSNVVETERNRNPLFWMGNALRHRVTSTFPSDRQADALMRGLLIGDTGALAASAMEDLRRAGLAHFVAVSGSNVAIFLGAWWLVTFPLSIRPRLRALMGVVGLSVFIVATRWEASVVRASVMASVPLVGAFIGVPVDPWMALGLAVTVVLLVSAHLATSVGFLLSVFATAGVMVGVRIVSGWRPSWLTLPLGATVGAQIAVAPILLAVFGSIPFLAPVTNLVAAPIVTASTVVGLVAVAFPMPVVASVAGLGADALLVIAERSAGGPQLGLVGCLVVAGAASLTAWRRTRPIGIAVTALSLVVVVSHPSPWPATPTAVVMNIGQGDAILLQDPSGLAVLVDGGREPRVLDRALRRHNVDHLAILVVTHGDADHAGGLVEMITTMDIGELWLGRHTAEAPLLDELAAAASERNIPIRKVERGDRFVVGEFDLSVLGPARKYLAENDGSVIILASAARSILLAGDAEAVAQRELPPMRPDVLVVPHHGSSTTDLGWLRATLRNEAILSYGPNTYGHPSEGVVALLEESGVTIERTADDGDVVVDLGRP